jgi:hypothetical protein
MIVAGPSLPKAQDNQSDANHARSTSHFAVQHHPFENPASIVIILIFLEGVPSGIPSIMVWFSGGLD